MMLDYHNKYRAEIANGREPMWSGHPKAADMFKMEWSDEMEQEAQKWADHCEDGHPPYPHEYGQNAAKLTMRGGGVPSMTMVIFLIR